MEDKLSSDWLNRRVRGPANRKCRASLFSVESVAGDLASTDSIQVFSFLLSLSAPNSWHPAHGYQVGARSRDGRDFTALEGRSILVSENLTVGAFNSGEER